MMRRGMMRWCLVAPFALVLAFTSPAFALAPEITSVEITSRPIKSFRIGSTQTQFGPFEFMGGLELTAASYSFGAMSSFRFLEPGKRILGVTDTGMWFSGTVERDENLRPTGFADFTMQQILDGRGLSNNDKWSSDAESVAVKGDRAIVGFERIHRIIEYKIDTNGMGAPIGEIDPLIPRHELRSNAGFETLAFAPQDSALDGALVVISEQSLDEQGNVLAAILGGPLRGNFTVKRDSAFAITDGAFLDNGDLLLLERHFSIATGVAMRLRRIRAETIVPGGVADGPVLLKADMAYQIDNMEGLDVWRAPDGALMVSLISDDNRSMFQRNLYLEFRYIGE